MDSEKAIEILEKMYPVTAKLVEGRYIGGIVDKECEEGKAITAAIKALDKTVKMKPKSDEFEVDNKFLATSYSCPNCGRYVGKKTKRVGGGYKDNYCGSCGQAIDWGGI